MRNHTLRFILLLLGAAIVVALFTLRLKHESTPPATPTVISAGNDFTSLRIADLRGRYVLVNFWDSQNAISRIASAEYDRWVKDHPACRLALVQVNTDTDPALWSEIVSHDEFDPATQFHLTSVEAKGPVTFRPTDGHASYLLSPEGKIIARNPSLASLSTLVPSTASLAKLNK